jgi:hypothetical protein
MRGHLEQLGKKSAIVLGDLGGGFQVALGDDQDMGGSLGVDVPERHHVVRGVDDVGRNLLPPYLAEQAIAVALRHNVNLA